jgi:hypothetical protein
MINETGDSRSPSPSSGGDTSRTTSGSDNGARPRSRNAHAGINHDKETKPTSTRGDTPGIINTPPTPNGEGERSDDGGSNNMLSFTPRRAMASFENLVAMANHQERLKEARKMVWRDRGQPVVQMDTLEECLRHAIAGGCSESLSQMIKKKKRIRG